MNIIMVLKEIVEEYDKQYKEAMDLWNKWELTLNEYKEKVQWIKYYKETALQEIYSLFFKINKNESSIWIH